MHTLHISQGGAVQQVTPTVLLQVGTRARRFSSFTRGSSSANRHRAAALPVNVRSARTVRGSTSRQKHSDAFCDDAARLSSRHFDLASAIAPIILRPLTCRALVGHRTRCYRRIVTLLSMREIALQELDVSNQ